MHLAPIPNQTTHKQHINTCRIFPTIAGLVLPGIKRYCFRGDTGHEFELGVYFPGESSCCRKKSQRLLAGGLAVMVTGCF